MSEEMLTHQFFTPLIGTPFAIMLPADSPPFMVHLEAVTPLSPPRRRRDAGEGTPVTDGPARQEPFSLHFRGPLDHPLSQGTYRMTTETIPTPLDIFIVPIGREPTGFIYEAIFG